MGNNNISDEKESDERRWAIMGYEKDSNGEFKRGSVGEIFSKWKLLLVFC